MSKFITGLITGICMILVIAYILAGERDDSDMPGKRSGMRVHTDAKTGVQYFSTANGGITPRLNSDGSLVTAPIEKQ